MSCGCKMIIREGEIGTRFSGYALAVGKERAPSPAPDAVPAWVELACMRPEEHPLNGSDHWWESEYGARFTWHIDKDTIWLA